MFRHEAHCTLNPNRHCKMCIWLQGVDSNTVDELIEAAKLGLKELGKAADHCPACMLAAIRQLRKAEPEHPQFSEWSDSSTPNLNDFDYQKALVEFWKIIRDGELHS